MKLMLKATSIILLLMLGGSNPAFAGPHEIQFTAELGPTTPDLGLNASMGCSFVMDDTFVFDVAFEHTEGIGGGELQRLTGGTVGATYQLDFTQVVPFLNFSVGVGHIDTNRASSLTLMATLGMGFYYRVRDTIDLGLALSKLSTLGLNRELSAPTRINLALRYRFEQ
jgi:hypothetical protein